MVHVINCPLLPSTYLPLHRELPSSLRKDNNDITQQSASRAKICYTMDGHTNSLTQPHALVGATPRSPPSRQQSWSDMFATRTLANHHILDTSHVPCKFFRQGACQAGSACPFSHDISANADSVCKYFAKVSCSLPTMLFPRPISDS